MTVIPLAVGPGTTVPPDLTIKLFGKSIIKLSLAELAYGRVLALRAESKVFPMPIAGIGGLEATYRKMEAEWLEYAGKGQIDLICHSQNALHAFRFAITHPDKVRRVLLVNGPFHGADLAHQLRMVPCAADMSPESQYLLMVHAMARDYVRKTRRALRRNPNYVHPEIHFIGLKHDGIVRHHSPYLDMGDLARYHCIGGGEHPDFIFAHTQWHGLEVDPSHFTVISDHESVAVLGRILEGELHGRATPQPHPVGNLVHAA